MLKHLTPFKKLQGFGLIFVVLLLITNSVLAQDKSGRKLHVSYVEYPQNEWLINLIRDVYSELGYTVSMIPTPATRGLSLLNDGTVDADALRLKRTAENYANAIIVEPAVLVSKLVLICVKEILCEQNILESRGNVVLTTDGLLPYLEEYNIKAKIESIQMFTNIVEMLTAKRVNYALFILDESNVAFKDFNQVVLQDISLFHIIHKKHANILPSLELKLLEKMTAFKTQNKQKKLNSQQ